MTSLLTLPHLYRPKPNCADDGWCTVCHWPRSHELHVELLPECPSCCCDATSPRLGCWCVVPGCVCPDPTLVNPSNGAF